MKAPPGKSCPSCGERYDPDVLFCPKDGTPLAASARTASGAKDNDFYIGTELAGQIRLKHLIGIGSMGRVYLAWQGGIDRDVAVKVLHRELSGNQELVKRFHREAKVASRLIHQNVVQVLMTGAVPFTADPRMGGELYLVMEYLDGMSLLSALVAAGPTPEAQALPLPRALHIALQICDAVGEAHAQQIVHRDLKPENVMLVRRGEDKDYVKVLDFGIARLDWADKPMETQAGLIFGTAKYISPEGAEGLPVGPEGDVYAIATMLYQMLAGRTPFDGDSPVALLVQHAHAPATELRDIARASYVPAPLAAVIMQNLAKKPSDRAKDARTFGKELVVAARASGLYPEEMAAKSTLFAGFGGVKLASKERTKALDLSADLAKKIGGVAAKPVHVEPPPDEDESEEEEGDATPTAPAAPMSKARPSRPLELSPRAGQTQISPTIPASSEDLEIPVSVVSRASQTPSAPRSRPSKSRPGPSEERVAAPKPDLDFDDAEKAAEAHEEHPPLPTPGPTPTIQGTETSVSAPKPRRPRAPIPRAVLAVVAFMLFVPIAIFGGKKFGAFGSAAPNEADTAYETGRDCVRRHAWDAPAQPNVKEITDRALSRWPDDGRFQDLRREAAEMLVSDALGKKYAGDSVGAIALAKLAADFNPAQTTAQRLVQDLEKVETNDAPPPPVPTATAEKPSKPRRSSKEGRSAPSASASAAPRATPSASTQPSAPGPAGGPDKPPAPPSTGPWL